MLASLTTKLALRKVGLSSDSFNFSSPAPAAPPPPKRSKSSKEPPPPGSVPGLDDKDEASDNWPSWLTVKNLPLTVQPWLAPPPPPVPIGEIPKLGDLAPIDRDRKVTCGGGRLVLVVFLRCVGCAFAQKTFLNLRTIANKHPNILCIAVSHSSAAATQKWIDLLGGAWAVQVVIDEDRAVYSAWGLGLGSVWSVLNPNTQIQGWKEKGWLGQTVASSISKTGTSGSARGKPVYQTGGTGVIDTEGPMTVMGNKWQSAGAWALDGTGKVVWGGSAKSADDVMDLEAGVKALGL